jgi:HEAT repeat protein
MTHACRRAAGLNWVLVGPALAALISVADATTVRFCTPVEQSMPDPLHVADSAVGIAFGRFTRVDGVLPPRFRVERLLAGTLPDSFTVRGHGYYFKDERCALILVRRPECMDAFALRYRRYAQDFDAIRVPQITGEFPGYGNLYSNDERIVQLAASLWHPSEQSPQELRRRLHLWLTRTGGACAPTLATEVLTRHPELRDSVMEAALLERCRGPESWWGRELSARALGMRPDSAIRAAARAMRSDGVDERYTAVLLVARDTLPESRSWLISAIRDSNDLVAETAIEAMEPERHPAERGALIEFALGVEATVKELTRTAGADGEAVPDSLGQLMVDPNHLRVVALHKLGSGTSTTVRLAIVRTIREPSYSCCGSEGEEISDSDEEIMTLDADELAECWTQSELVAALSDPMRRVRFLACKETARRRDVVAAAVMLDHLRRDRLPNGVAPDVEETKQLIAALGVVGDTVAVPELIRRVDLPNAFAFGGMRNWDVRAAAVEALGNIDDPRALGLLRTLAASVATDTVWVRAKWNALYSVPQALTGHGDYRDVPFFKKMASLNADRFPAAARAIASVAGPEAFFEFLDENKVRRLRLTDALFIDSWISGTCKKIAGR